MAFPMASTRVSARDKLIAILLTAVLVLALTACGNPNAPRPDKPVTLTMWHSFVEGTRDSFDELVSEFNSTVGAENGIVIKVTMVADANIINEQLVAAAKEDPGAVALPDMAVVYPRIAVTLAETGALVDLGEQFSQAELDSFVPQFVEEGRLGGDKLYLLPITKSTEVLYLNRTLFDRFSAETGVGIDKLATFEGIAETAVRYGEWTDAKTPDVHNDGKIFFYPEGLFNQAMIGFQQLGGNVIRDQALNFSDPVFQRIWDFYYPSAVKGGTAIFDGYGNYLTVSGDVVCTLASSAGASFYPTQLTYPDNTKEDVVFDVLPYPVYEGGEKVVFQRGGGICVMKSEPVREYAAGVFLKWFTAAERNLGFTSAIGYMPVRTSAFDDIVAGNIPAIENPTVEKALRVTAQMQTSYRFYFPPVFDGFDTLQGRYNERLRQAALDGREEYLRLLTLPEQDATTAFEQVSRDALQAYIDGFNP